MAETILGYNDSILLYNNCMIRVNYGSSTWGDASGGIITYDGDYKIHTFNSSDNFIVYSTIDASVLIVGGGGPGDLFSGGGGGEVIILSTNLQTGIYDIKVGIGGFSPNTPENSIDGGVSSFNNIDARGGHKAVTDNAGGTSGSGFVGGGMCAGGDPPVFAGGGGGGDSSTGKSGVCNYQQQMSWGGDGGVGTHSTISGTDIGYGGGGGGLGTDYNGIGNDGGGDVGQSGIPNTGGGGGSGNFISIKSGGSGVVIIRYKYK